MLKSEKGPVLLDRQYGAPSLKAKKKKAGKNIKIYK